MKSVLLKFIGSILFPVFLISCNSVKYENSEKVSQKDIFQNYFVSYNAQSENLTVQAVFYQNNPAGKTLKLSGKSQVSFNDEKLDGIKTDALGYVYQRNLTGTIPEKLQFRYENNDGTTFNNNIILKMFEISGKKIEISKTATVNIEFKGTEFSEDEDLICNIVQNGKEMHSFYPNILSKSSIQFVSDDIELLKPGEYACYFVRRNSSTNVRSLNRGGLWESEYISKKTDIIITD